MSRWSRPKKVVDPETDQSKIEIEGLVAQCQYCREQTDVTFYLPEVKALTWKCSGCDRINIVEDFGFPV